MRIKKVIKKQFDNSYDTRNVIYERIHEIKQKDFDSLIEITNVINNDTILDAGAGYGAITREILKKNTNKDISIYLVDNSEKQLKRAIIVLKKIFGEESLINRTHFILDDLRCISFEDNYFDKIIAKMVIHEIPQSDILKSIKELHRVLKPNSKIYFWDLTLSETNQYIVRKIIKMKDKLAGYSTLVVNRYFLTLNEWYNLLMEANFNNIVIEKEINYTFNTRKRLEDEFNSSIEKLEQLHSLIRREIKKAPNSLLEEIQYQDNGDEITFKVSKSIISAKK